MRTHLSGCPSDVAGTTIVELLISVVLVSVLAVTGVPAFSSFIQANRLDESAIDCSTGCGSTTLAQYDLYELELAANGVAAQDSGGSNRGGLTLPTTCITGPNGGPGIYSVAIA